MHESYRFGGGVAETALNPIVLVAMILAIFMIVLLPRKLVIGPLLLIIFLTPPTQTAVVGGVHLFVARIVILFGVARLFTATFTSKTSVFAGGFSNIDKVFTWWAISQAVAFTLLYGKTDALINQFGFLWDTLGGYFLLRFALYDEGDIRRATKICALFAIIVAAGMVIEQRSMTNVFGFIGGRGVPDIREGKLRSQGPFAHAILAGVFGATIVPLFVRLWSTRKDRLVAVAGIVGATTMVITSGSSTPLGAYAAGLVGMWFWPLRKHMRVLRRGLVLLILALALVMKAPVWFLIARIDFVGGSSSYHRALLVDQCIQRVSEWWLLGASNNQHWGWDMWDVQNYFVAQALRGGLAGFVLFVMIVSRAFGRLGRARKRVVSDRQQEWLLWTLGSVMFAHVVAFFGADYFDQTRFWWYSSLAMVCAATNPLLTSKKKPVGNEPLHAPPDRHEIVQLSPVQIA
jgi:hypothetical protein